MHFVAHATPGDYFFDCVDDALNVSNKSKRNISMVFNCHQYLIEPGMDRAELIKQFDRHNTLENQP